MKRLILAIVLICIPITANAWWKSIQQVAVGSPPPSYVGPGDVVSGAVAWGSCARVYTASLASTSTNLCDLVNASTGAAVGTLRASASGFVDLSAYFTGSVTPMTACASGCRVSKIYDQVAGGSAGWVNAINSQRPTLTFSLINSLPGWTCVASANSNLQTSAPLTFSAPYTYVAMGVRTSNFTTLQSLMGWSVGLNGYLGFFTSANTVSATSGGGPTPSTLGSVPDSSFHALQGYIDSAGTANMVSSDGVDGSPASGGNAAPLGQSTRVCRGSGGLSLDGSMMEAGVWNVQFSPTERTDMNSNIHGSNGYNF